MAISGEIVTEEDLPEEEREDGRPFEAFDFHGREIHFAEPSSGQLYIIIGMMDVPNEAKLHLKIESVNNFGTVLKYLFTRTADRQHVMRGLATGEFELDEFFELAVDMVRQWAPEEVTNREQRRALAQDRPAPAKRAARAVKGGPRR
jgi:hypothetical protein